MKFTLSLIVGSKLAVLAAVVCLLMLTACGNGGVDKVASNGSVSTATNGNAASPITTSASPTTPGQTTKGNGSQAGENQNRDARNSNSRLTAPAPKPQIGSGGSDFSLYAQARAALASDAELQAANLIIEIKAGVLVLSGTVANAAQKSRAEQLMRGVSGVKEVKNRLQISH